MNYDKSIDDALKDLFCIWSTIPIETTILHNIENPCKQNNKSVESSFESLHTQENMKSSLSTTLSEILNKINDTYTYKSNPIDQHLLQSTTQSELYLYSGVGKPQTDIIQKSQNLNENIDSNDLIDIYDQSHFYIENKYKKIKLKENVDMNNKYISETNSLINDTSNINYDLISPYQRTIENIKKKILTGNSIAYTKKNSMNNVDRTIDIVGLHSSVAISKIDFCEC